MKQQYAPPGPLALQPEAFGIMVEVEEAPAAEMRDGAAVLTIRGPLMHHPSLFFDSYDAIEGRALEAVTAGATSLVLDFDCPGGLALGCFDLARALRAMCDEAEIPLLAYVDGVCASAAYAVASQADRIVVSKEALVGSVGVIDALVDATAQEAAMGLRTVFVVSGKRKPDGNPLAGITEGAVEAMQERVDALAASFFELVADGRGVSADDVASLEAGVFTGATAVRLGLADDVGTLADVLALAGTPTNGGAAMAMDEDNKEEAKAGGDDMDAVKARLRKMAEGDGEEAKKARRALKAMDEDDEGEKSKAKAMDDDEEHSKASAGVQALARVHELEAKIEARAKADERKRLLDSRPDFDADFRASLELPSTPLAYVRDKVKNLPQRSLRPAIDTTVQAPRGALAGDAHGLDPAVKAQMDQVMGLTETTYAVTFEDGRQTFGARVPVKKGA